MHARLIPVLIALSLVACRKDDDTPLDLDNDGYSQAVDCDDTDATVHPDAEEVCDGIDNNCDAAVDEDPVDAPTWYADGDGDGFGDGGAATAACEAPEGYVAQQGDCDDSSAAFHPGAPETDCADPADYNCDGSVGYADADGDGVPACEECDDGDAAVHPGAEEVCDGVDNDCNGLVDDDPSDVTRYYADIDGDGFAGDRIWVDACEAPEGYLDAVTDCDDFHAESHPGAEEACDGLDNDCDGVVPGGEADADGDGFMGCEGDCDDGDARRTPTAVEVCDGVDNNCDELVDMGAVDASLWFADADADGYGDAGAATRACEAPQGAVADDSDCDDLDAGVHPGAAEVCDGVDQDCDGSVDDNPTDAATWYLDADGDGFGGRATQVGCHQPAGWVGNTDDCDDLDRAVYPGAPERCDGLLSDCDLSPIGADEADADGDGFMSCEGDCDDGDPEVSPLGVELCDEIDNDCDGTVDNPEEVLGDGEACAAMHCSDLLAWRPYAVSGAYWIDSAGHAAPYEAYCDMETEGGGWTLALKADGTSATFAYDSSYWTDDVLLNESWADMEHMEAKYESFVTLPFAEVLLGMEYPVTDSSLEPNWLTVDQYGDSLMELFGSEVFVPTSLGRAAWKAWMPGSSLQSNCNAEGFNVSPSTLVGPAQVRIGILGNQEANCETPDSRIGIGGGTGTYCSMPANHTVGNVARCTPDNGDLTWYAWGTVALRCDVYAEDLAGDGLDTNCDGVDGVDADRDGSASFESGGLDCDDADPSVSEGVGCPVAESCAAVLASDPSAEDGLYAVDPDGSGPIGAFAAYCDMTAEGGGWTLIAKVHRYHEGPSVDEPNDWFQQVRDLPALRDAATYAARTPGQASLGMERIAALGAGSALARFEFIAEDDVDQRMQFFKAVDAGIVNWTTTVPHAPTTVCTDAAMTDQCEDGDILGGPGLTTDFDGMSTEKYGYTGGRWHMRLNADAMGANFSALCSSTGDADDNAWHDNAIDGHWGNGLAIWVR
ncbi:MAG: hypothetical protein JXX28_14515 [Deltaproteobacteria bacterium]|nr:hypothetical protein [Deltaproteobacteria bacterium]